MFVPVLGFFCLFLGGKYLQLRNIQKSAIFSLLLETISLLLQLNGSPTVLDIWNWISPSVAIQTTYSALGQQMSFKEILKRI